ncbi:MAG: hypothetical protein ABW133_17530 [Polyangiaceae bacterium]
MSERIAAPDDDLVSATVDTRFGVFVDAHNSPAVLEDFASAIPELLSSQRVSGSVVIGQLDHAVTAELHDIVLVSPKKVHFAQRLPQNSRHCLVCVAPRNRSVGLILSEARARMTRE